MSSYSTPPCRSGPCIEAAEVGSGQHPPELHRNANRSRLATGWFSHGQQVSEESLQWVVAEHHATARGREHPEHRVERVNDRPCALVVEATFDDRVRFVTAFENAIGLIPDRGACRAREDRRGSNPPAMRRRSSGRSAHARSHPSQGLDLEIGRSIRWRSRLRRPRLVRRCPS